MGNKQKTIRLSKREKQIVEVVYNQGKASVIQVREQIDNPPSAGALRRLMNILREKGVLRSEFVGPTNYYYPAQDTSKLALSGVVNTFFKGSAAKAMASLMEDADLNISKEEFELLNSIIEKAQKED